MNFFNRAIKNVTRKMSKSILLLITFFVIGNFVIIGLGVSQASESAKVLTRQKMRAVVNYELDYNAINKYLDSVEDEDEMNKFYENYPRINASDVQEFLKDERVKTANAVSNNMWYSDADGSLDFVRLHNQAEANIDESNGMSCWIDADGVQQCESYREPYFMVKTNYFPNMIEFEDGDYKIVDGRFYNQEEIDNNKLVAVISENLANTNNLRVGDTFKICTNNTESSWFKEMGISEDAVTFEFEVVGLFTHNHPITPATSGYDYIYPYENLDNTIFIPTTTSVYTQLEYSIAAFDYYAQQWPEDEYYSNPDNRPTLESIFETMYIDNVTLLLNDPLEVDNFVNDYKDKIKQFTMLDANNEQFETLSKPLDTLSMYAEFIVGLVIVNAIIIITLVTALTLKTREYEIGVLLSIGASKIKVVLQFFVELALVAIIGFSLSVVSGSLIAKKIGNSVLEYQIASSGLVEEEESEYVRYYSDYDPWNTDYSTDITLDDLIAEYEVSISPLIIGEIYVLGLGIVLVSVIIPSIMIMRFNPKKILMNQN